MPDGKPRLPVAMMRTLDDAFKLVPEAKEAFSLGEIIRAAALIARYGTALLNEGDTELGTWLQETGLSLRMRMPFNTTV